MSQGEAPIRLAFCITDLDRGGAEHALVEIVRRLDRGEWEPAVFCLGPEGVMAELLREAEIPVTCLGARSARDIGVLSALTRHLRKFQPALLQTFLHHANMAGRFAAWRARVPRVVSGVRVAERRSRLPLRMDRLTHRLVDHYVCVSDDVAEFTIQHARIPAEKVSVIPNGVDARLFADAEPADLGQFGIPADAITVIFVGRLDPQKNPLALLEAAGNLFTIHPRLHLLLVGEGPLRPELESWIAARDCSDRVHLAGQQESVAGLLRAADIFVLPSLWEGMPNAVLEAMAAGLPVIASRVEGCGQLIEPHQTGLLVPPGSTADLTAALALTLSDSDQAKEMGISAQRHVMSEFTWETVASRYADLYRQLVRL